MINKKVIQFPFLHPLIIFQTNQNPSILLSSTKPDLTGTCYSNVPERYYKPKCELPSEPTTLIVVPIVKPNENPLNENNPID